MPKFNDFPTTPEASKAWINPENEIIPLRTWHYEYFRDHPQIAAKYGVVFRDEETTRLVALRVGFVRVNYERQGLSLIHIWNIEYLKGSQRDQLSFMYCVWKTGVPLFKIPQHARENSYYKSRGHLLPRMRI